jgi:hypothetical protein
MWDALGGPRRHPTFGHLVIMNHRRAASTLDSQLHRPGGRVDDGPAARPKIGGQTLVSRLAATASEDSVEPPRPDDALAQGEGNDDAAKTKNLKDKALKLSDAERRFLLANAHLAGPFMDAANAADALASAYTAQHFQGNDVDIRGDHAGNALRHATWSALMVQRAFSSWVGGGDLNAAALKAFEFGTAHEENPRNTNRVNKAMDLHNNSVGRNVALQVLRGKPKATDQEIFKAVVQALGSMREVSPDGTSLVKASG